ncbi:MAG: hypothetical protein ACRCZ2_01450 [Fusobacteriaceae bacterium]
MAILPKIPNILKQVEAIEESKLDKNGKAVDSEKLDGKDSDYFATKSEISELNSKKLNSTNGIANGLAVNGTFKIGNYVIGVEV